MHVTGQEIGGRANVTACVLVFAGEGAGGEGKANEFSDLARLKPNRPRGGKFSQNYARFYPTSIDIRHL